ncbi:MAG: hypothetical protein ACNYZG_01200, partial [Gammaproteobacteria bacterium]
MSLYSIDKLINETRRLAAEFKRTTGTMLPVSGEIARYDVSRQLDLTLNEDHNSGYDAIGNKQREGLRVQIKSRVIGDSVKSGHRIGQLNPNGSWDIVILSLMNNEFEALEMYQLDHKKVAEALTSASEKRGKRGAISVAKFRIIGDLVWSKEHGLEDFPNYDNSDEIGHKL